MLLEFYFYFTAPSIIQYVKGIEARLTHSIAAYGPMVFSRKYRGKVLVGDVPMVAEAIISKTCKEIEIKIIDMSVSSHHIPHFIQYLLKYSVSYITNELQN